jgi:putative inorganic carbon (hco3(-)) transporter
VSFFLPITIAISEVGTFIVVLAAFALRATGRLPGDRRLPFRLVVPLFAGAALAASLVGLRPAFSVWRCTRLLLLGLAFATPWLFGPDGRGWAGLRRAVVLFVAGACVKAVYDLVRVPAVLAWTWWSGRAPSVAAGNRFGASSGWSELLFSLGNMREPQMYMVALALVLGLVVAGVWSWRDRRVLAALAVLGVAFLLHFKRGAWLAFGGSMLVAALLARDWRLPLLLVAVGASMLLVPKVRERLAQLRNEQHVALGGRRALWTEIAPALVRQHPFGVGYKGLRHEDLVAISPHVQPRLNHLHNSALEVLVETGWAGLAAWLALVVRALQVQVRVVLAARRRDAAAYGLALGVLAGFLALLLNGMVENNFGDTEIFLLMAWLLGLTAFLDRRRLPW